MTLSSFVVVAERNAFMKLVTLLIKQRNILVYSSLSVMVHRNAKALSSVVIIVERNTFLTLNTMLIVQRNILT